MFKVWYREIRLGMFKKNIVQDKKEAPGLGSALVGGGAKLFLDLVEILHEIIDGVAGDASTADDFLRDEGH